MGFIVHANGEIFLRIYNGRLERDVVQRQVGRGCRLQRGTQRGQIGQQLPHRCADAGKTGKIDDPVADNFADAGRTGMREAGKFHHWVSIRNWSGRCL